MLTKAQWARLPDFFATSWGPEIFLFLVAVFVFPVVCWVAMRYCVEDKRAQFVWGFIIGAVVLAFGDVVVIGAQGFWLCSHDAGLRVYKTVKTDGYVSIYAQLVDLRHSGFSYMEDSVNSTVKYRYTMVDDKLKTEVIPEFTSRYELAEEWDESLCCSTRRSVVRDRQTGEVFGELQTVGLKGGWLDNFLWSFIPADRGARLCEDTSGVIRGGTLGLDDDLINIIQPLGAK